MPIETEENILAINGCPHLEAHKQEHKQYLEIMAGLLYKAINDNMDKRVLAETITEQMYDHLLKTDMECKEFMKQQSKPTPSDSHPMPASAS